MKLTDTDSNIDTTEDEKFYDRLSKIMDKYMTYGMAASDGQGHGENVSFRLESQAFHMLNIIKRNLPEKWQVKKMDHKRNYFTAILAILTDIIQHTGGLNFEEMKRCAWKLETVNEIESIIRDQETEERIKQVRAQVENMNPKSKGYNKIVKLLRKLDADNQQVG